MVLCNALFKIYNIYYYFIWSERISVLVEGVSGLMSSRP